MNSLRSYARIVFFTGAGMSAESGVPTYRGKGGIQDQYDYQDVACQKAFERDPRKVLAFHEMRRLYRPCMGRDIGLNWKTFDPLNGLLEEQDIGFRIPVPRAEGAQIDVEAQKNLFVRLPQAVVILKMAGGMHGYEPVFPSLKLEHIPIL